MGKGPRKARTKYDLSKEAEWVRLSKGIYASRKPRRGYGIYAYADGVKYDGEYRDDKLV